MGCFNSKEAKKPLEKTDSTEVAKPLRKTDSQKSKSSSKRSKSGSKWSKSVECSNNEKSTQNKSVSDDSMPRETSQNSITNENFSMTEIQERINSEASDFSTKVPLTPNNSFSDFHARGDSTSASEIGDGHTPMSTSLRKKLKDKLVTRKAMSLSLPVEPKSVDLHTSPDLTREEMVEWKTPNTGFEKLLASDAGKKLFHKFLKKEFSSENLQFWVECEKLKSIPDGKPFKDHVDVIFKIYLMPSALEEVSLEGRVKESLMKNRANPERTIFDEAQTKIYSLMHRDSFPRFLNSKVFKEALAKFPSSPPVVSEETDILRRESLEGHQEVSVFTQLGVCTDALLLLAEQGQASTPTEDTDKPKPSPLTEEAKEIIATCSIEAPTEHKTVKDNSGREKVDTKEGNAVSNTDNSNSRDGKKDAKEDRRGQ